MGLAETIGMMLGMQADARFDQSIKRLEAFMEYAGKVYEMQALRLALAQQAAKQVIDTLMLPGKFTLLSRDATMVKLREEKLRQNVKRALESYGGNLDFFWIAGGANVLAEYRERLLNSDELKTGLINVERVKAYGELLKQGKWVLPVFKLSEDGRISMIDPMQIPAAYNSFQIDEIPDPMVIDDKEVERVIALIKSQRAAPGEVDAAKNIVGNDAVRPGEGVVTPYPMLLGYLKDFRSRFVARLQQADIPAEYANVLFPAYVAYKMPHMFSVYTRNQNYLEKVENFLKQSTMILRGDVSISSEEFKNFMDNVNEVFVTIYRPYGEGSGVRVSVGGPRQQEQRVARWVNTESVPLFSIGGVVQGRMYGVRLVEGRPLPFDKEKVRRMLTGDASIRLYILSQVGLKPVNTSEFLSQLEKNEIEGNFIDGLVSAFMAAGMGQRVKSISTLYLGEGEKEKLNKIANSQIIAVKLEGEEKLYAVYFVPASEKILNIGNTMAGKIDDSVQSIYTTLFEDPSEAGYVILVPLETLLRYAYDAEVKPSPWQEGNDVFLAYDVLPKFQIEDIPKLEIILPDPDRFNNQ